MPIPLYQVDAFTPAPYAGNPAAVCLLDGPGDPAWMQAVAGEMNLSETAFLYPHGDAWPLRWFTPSTEVDLCGHATLASAHVLWESGRLAPDAEARFTTRSGLLTARRDGDWIELNLPERTTVPCEAPPGLAAALGAPPEWVGRYRRGSEEDYLVALADAGVVRQLQPDFAALRRHGWRGVIVTAPGDAGYDFVSRYFAPGYGIDEDPVTGAAHCTLGPYWATRLERDHFTAYQASARGGVVRVRVSGERVILGGQAVTVLRGELI